MKKIITVLFCTAVFTSAFAQTNRHDADDRNKNVNPTWNSNNNQKGYDNDHDRDNRSGAYDKRYNNNNGYQNNNYNSQRNIQIQRITQQYDYRIQQVSYNRSLNRRQKERAIAQLQAEKAQALNSIYTQNNNRNVYNDRDNGYNNNNGNYRR
jgi:hypothetical protein